MTFNSSSRKDQSDTALIRSQGPVHIGQAISSSRTSGSSYLNLTEDSEGWVTTTSSKAGADADPLSDVIPLFTNGFFKIGEPDSSFEETCNLCASPNSTLVFFLRQPPSKLSTPGFPSANSVSKLTYPLAMGNFPETDILSKYICCDSCSFLLAQSGKTPTGDDISCVLPLVSYKTNGPAYLKQLRLAFNARFDDSDTVMVFLAVLLTVKEKEAANFENEVWHRAVTWLCRNLMKEKMPDLVSIEEVFLHNLDRIYQRFTREEIFGYPLEGFVTLILATDCMETRPDLPHGIANVIWQRFLRALVDQYHEYRRLMQKLRRVW